jgi:hypothetical protein
MPEPRISSWATMGGRSGIILLSLRLPPAIISQEELYAC